MAFLFVIVDLLVFASVTARWCYSAARRMLPQTAAPPTTRVIYAVADDSFDVTAAITAFYDTERAPVIDTAAEYLRKYARVDVHTLTLYVTYRSRVHVVAIDMRGRKVTWGQSIAFGSMRVEDLLEYSVLVDLSTMMLVARVDPADDSEEIPDLSDFDEDGLPSVNNTPPYVNLTGDDYEANATANKFAARDEKNINLRASVLLEQ